ncbi:MAG: SRPBCC family protein [Chloroflexi bacterium]|nr:SRPBCC family protein [Chloroflexota bacterium]
MPTIDQRILLPAPPDLVWQYVGEPSKHPLWWQGCEAALPLSETLHTPGSRWRYTINHGPDLIIELNAYLSRTGFEYTVVDGLAVKNGQGRFRLQEVSEGTALHWSFEYQNGGVFGRMGRGKRYIENQMEHNLRNLWQIIQDLPAQSRAHEPRVSAQLAPDADSRADYVSRHENRTALETATTTAENASATMDDTQLLPSLSEATPAGVTPQADLDDTSIITVPHLASDEDTPAHPIPAIQSLTSNLFETSVMKSMEEELSIFDLFGIQRLTASTAAEENDPSQNPSSAIGWRELQSGSLRNDTQSGVGRPREGARLRNRRQLLRNL